MLHMGLDSFEASRFYPNVIETVCLVKRLLKQKIMEGVRITALVAIKMSLAKLEGYAVHSVSSGFTQTVKMSAKVCMMLSPRMVACIGTALCVALVRRPCLV